MRYNVHSPCTFHDRIAKTLGVLVGAALIATLGLPSAAQAQTIPNPKGVTNSDRMAPGHRVRRWLASRSTWGLDALDTWRRRRTARQLDRDVHQAKRR